MTSLISRHMVIRYYSRHIDIGRQIDISLNWTKY